MHLSLSGCPVSLAVLEQGQRNGGGGGGGLHNHCLLSSSQRIHFQTITFFPTHADTHTSLIQRGFISYHLRNHYQNTDTICFRVVCGSPVMANARNSPSPVVLLGTMYNALSLFFSKAQLCLWAPLNLSPAQSGAEAFSVPEPARQTQLSSEPD